MIETTEHVIAARRLVTLRDLGRDLAEARTVAEACQHAARILGRNQTDLPFSIIYLLDGNSRRARLAAASGVGTRRPDDLETFELDDAACRLPSVAQVLANNRGERVELGCTLRGLVETEANDAMVLPLVRAGTAAYGVLVAGIDPHRQLDDDYRGFYNALADSVTTALASVHACEDERARADALAAIDRARTEFFSDISHEFRTPLTLMLGPLEEVLRRPLTREVHQDLAMVHRNALRLLNLVNALLDFSRIEAGRVDAVYQPTDLATLTAELACMFRSAIERAGLRLTVECPPLPEPVYVDRDMWEKIVLNLLSNAFKFTLRGEIAVTLRMVDRQVELRVRDTGVGIPSSRLPHIFERFHRTNGDHARAREGTGIGLALVKQLVALHGGTITADSVEGRATTLVVSIPCGTDHLRSDQIDVSSAPSSTATGSSGVFDRASQWVAVESAGDAHDPAEEQDSGAVDSERRARIVCADDNADMRAYLVRLLSPRYDVEAVADGLAVLRATQRRLPDLVVADVMMPRMDGLALLRALRDDPATRIVPVLLLTARARDQSRVGGLESGADDYLVKPFSSRELLARVKAHVEIGRIRRALRKESAALAAMEASEAERRRISRELHDELGQELTALVLGLKAARDTVPAESAMHRHLQRLQGMAAEVSRDMHRIALELRPGALDDQGLQMALSNYVEEWSRRYDIHADFQCVDLSTRRLPPVVETTVYRVVQEALANVGKHAKATTVSVVLQLRRPHEIVAIVEDDGCGFDPNRAEAGRRLGITGMKERAILVGGECLIESTAGGGTTILLRVPLDSRIHSDA